MEYKAKILWGMSLSDIDKEMGEITKAEYEGGGIDRPRMWDLLETKKRYLAAQARLNEQQNRDNSFTEITTEDIYNEIKNEEEKTMSNNFELNGYTYTESKGRYYKTDANGKKTRIGYKEFGDAASAVPYEGPKTEEPQTEEKPDTTPLTDTISEAAEQEMEEDEWEAEAEAEYKAREDKIAEDAKATEDAVNGSTKKAKEKTDKKSQPKAETKEKAKKPRRSKDIAHEHKDGEVTITLTAKQVDFVLHLSDSCFWERGLDSILWCDVLVDEIGGQFEGKPMTIGAMISTLCEKGLGIRTKDRITDATTGKSRKSTTFQLTEKGKEIAKELGLK